MSTANITQLVRWYCLVGLMPGLEGTRVRH